MPFVNNDTLKRWEDLAGRLVRAVEKIAAALAPPEDGDVETGRAPAPTNDAKTVERIAELERLERLRNHHAGIILKKLEDLKNDDQPPASVEQDDMPEECGHGNAAHSCGLCMGPDKGHPYAAPAPRRTPGFKLGDATVVKNDAFGLNPGAHATAGPTDGVEFAPQADARSEASECPHGRQATYSCGVCSIAEFERKAKLGDHDSLVILSRIAAIKGSRPAGVHLRPKRAPEPRHTKGGEHAPSQA